jgi:ADP-ribose pyrophosphatase
MIENHSPVLSPQQKDTIMEEQIISTEDIFQGRVIHLKVHQVRLPDGSTSKREVVQHPGAVAIVPIDTDGNVLLVEQYRTAAGRMMTEIPAGTLDPNETPLACAEREMQEETGYKPRQMQALGGFYVAPGYTSEYIHLFYATDLIEARLQHDADEFITVKRVSLPQALKMIDDGVIVDGKSKIGLLQVARLLNV